MRYLTVVVIMLFCINKTHSQTYEVGPYFGGTNFIGDVGSTNFIAPNTLAYGGIFKWNRSKRHSFRATIISTELEADDAESHEARRKERGYSFTNALTEFSVGLEYTFWEWNLHGYDRQIAPYLYTGITGIKTNNLYLNANNALVEENEKYNMALPMVIGVKGTLTSHLILAFEMGARYTFTDNLDGSNPEEFDGGADYPTFGNPNTNDWYMFAGVTLTYTFGRKPCYCVF